MKMKMPKWKFPKVKREFPLTEAEKSAFTNNQTVGGSSMTARSEKTARAVADRGISLTSQLRGMVERARGAIVANNLTMAQSALRAIDAALLAHAGAINHTPENALEDTRPRRLPRPTREKLLYRKTGKIG